MPDLRNHRLGLAFLAKVSEHQKNTSKSLLTIAAERAVSPLCFESNRSASSGRQRVTAVTEGFLDNVLLFF